MIITKYNNYVKITSESIDALIDNVSGFSSIELNANINCCTTNCQQQIASSTITLGATSWNINLDEAVHLNSNITGLYFTSPWTGKEYNVIDNPIDLGYVEDNCGANLCTLEDYTAHFAPLFKAEIDAWFATIGVSSNVVITFTDNILKITTIPVNFIPARIEYGANTDSISFGFTDTFQKAFIGPDGLYISPAFFGLTKLMDGVYKFSVKLNKANNAGYTTEENCAFIDVTIKCKVASVLHHLHSEAANKTIEQSATLLHMLHYALVNGSDCGCNCDEMCQVYKELVNILNANPQIVNNCGC